MMNGFMPVRFVHLRVCRSVNRWLNRFITTSTGDTCFLSVTLHLPEDAIVNCKHHLLSISIFFLKTSCGKTLAHVFSSQRYEVALVLICTHPSPSLLLIFL